MKIKIILFILSLLFVLASFIPTFLDIYERPQIPESRAPDLVHNYLFDYNFYLSRIRQGIEGRFLVTEKYYNFSHTPSLFQIVYLLFGRIGGIFGLGVEAIYHSARFLFGLILLLVLGWWLLSVFSGWWAVAAFLIIITSGSWPILVQVEGGLRSATYMGWWSAIDSLQRIAFIPHVLIGQIFLMLFIYRYGKQPFSSRKSWIAWAAAALACGIIFPPTIIVIYIYFALISLFELVEIVGKEKNTSLNHWLRNILLARLIFVLFTIPPLIYLQIMVKFLPWSALPLMDILHRINIPYHDYAKALGPVLPLGLAGLVLALIRQDKKMLPFICWVISVGVLFLIFERVPQQSPLRFTEAEIHIPLGILATYLFLFFAKWNKWLRRAVYLLITVEVLTGLFVMWSMVGWLTDQVKTKKIGTWSAPLGVQLAYPLKDFMAGIEFFRLHTNTDDVVLTYITAGNYIPAYSGNHVYIGHINTPDEDKREVTSARFFSGKMKNDEAKELLQKENISYIFFGPQEKEIAWIPDLETVYPQISLERVYTNQRVIIYKVKNR